MSPDPVSVAASSAATAAGAVTLAMFGLPAQALLCAVIGAAAGIAFSRPMSVMRAVWVFVAMVVFGALAGTIVAREMFGGDELARNISSLLVGPLYPFVQLALIQHAPALVGRLREILTRSPK